MKLINVNKIYHNKNTVVHALHDVNLSFDCMGIYVIAGPSGCGKTTLLHILSGKDRSFEGKYEITGSVEIIEQELVLFEAMSIKNNLKLVCADDHKINDYLALFSLIDEKDKRVNDLSTGQKKRVQMIRSLLVNPSYLLCDEPTAGLDHENATLIMEALKKIAEKITVIVVTHEISIMELYSDYIIHLEEGKVIEEKRITPCEKNGLQETINPPKRIGRQIEFLFQQINARKVANLFKLVLIFIMVMTMYASSLFMAVDSASENKKKWQTGENLIVSQPKEEDGNTDTSGSFLYYDMYVKKDIQLIKDNVSDVIGYRNGWDREYLSTSTDWFIKEMNLQEAREFVKRIEQIKKETDVNPYGIIYEKIKSEIQRIDLDYPNKNFPDDIIIGFDYSYYLGFKEIQTENHYGYAVPDQEGWGFSLKQTKMDLVPYQMFDRYDMQLLYGEKMKKENEVVLSYYAAKELSKQMELSSIEDLIGKVYTMQVKKAALDEVSYESIGNIKITGIFYEGNSNEYQVYFNEGDYDRIFESFYGMKPEYLQYQFISLLVDEKANVEDVCEQINQLIDNKESTFMQSTKVAQRMDNKESYQKAENFYLFAIGTFLAFMVLYIVMEYMHFSRMKKENEILRMYQYHPLFIIIIKIIFLFMLVGILQLLLLPFLCDTLNQFANSLFYANIVHYDILQYLFAFIISLVVIIGIEGVGYAISTKKRM